MAVETTAPAEPPKQDDLQGDFTGNVKVSAKLPTQAELKKCEDLVVVDSKGTSRPFKSLYTGEGTAPRQLIIFVRHFFCGNCQEYLRTLASSISPESVLSLEKPTFITVIGCGRPELIDFYVETTKCQFPVYADPTRQLYDNLGMVRTLDMGSKPEYQQTGVLHGAVRSIMQGLKTGKNVLKAGDLKQVGGEFLFENGEAVWCHRMSNTRDHSEVGDIRQLLGMDEAKPPMRKTWSSAIAKFSRRSSSLGRPSKETDEKRNSSDAGRKSTDKFASSGSALRTESIAADGTTPAGVEKVEQENGVANGTAAQPVVTESTQAVETDQAKVPVAEAVLTEKPTETIVSEVKPAEKPVEAVTGGTKPVEAPPA